MRVITGTARGRRLVTPEGLDVRPTPEKVKEALFSALQFDIEGRRVLDLFAGSGQLGIEALSRGAKFATFVDNSQVSIKTVNKNLETALLTDKAKVVKGDYASFCASCRDTFDIVFLDPPYDAGFLLPAFKSVLPLMSDYGMIICEYPPHVEMPESIGGFEVSRSYRYGKINVSVYRKAENIWKLLPLFVPEVSTL